MKNTPTLSSVEAIKSHNVGIIKRKTCGQNLNHLRPGLSYVVIPLHFLMKYSGIQMKIERNSPINMKTVCMYE